MGLIFLREPDPPGNQYTVAYYFLALAVGLRITLWGVVFLVDLWRGFSLCFSSIFTAWMRLPPSGRTPPASIRRYAMDVWFFLAALVIHCRTGQKPAVLGAGALVGISLLLVLDSGIYLLVAFTGYLACRIIPHPGRSRET